MAIGAMRAIAERGLRIPDDISVVGVDDIEAGAFHNPPLTIIRQPVEEMTRASIEMPLNLINNQTPSEIQVSLAPSLVVRQTTARLKEAV
jgi:DNA-binding LacI/PurR family transcriptional regulator